MKCASVLFVDVTCPKPYSAASLATEPLGGTEATVIRVAEGLKAAGHQVRVLQHNRTEADDIYLPLDAADLPRPNAVVVLRSLKPVSQFRERFRDAKQIVWLHDFNLRDIVRDFPLLEGKPTVILGVSRTHKGAIQDAILSQIGFTQGVKVDFAYNPIADDLRPNDATVYHRRLIFFSSPHKGLSRTLEVFKHLRRQDRAFQLYVANPGYVPGSDHQPIQGVRDLGCLSHPEVIQHLREALCVFHLNDSFPETFGIVHAEALAVGTPIITASHGANYEVIRDPRFMLDVRDNEAVIKRVLAFAEERPKTLCPEEYRLSNVVKRWQEVLCGN
jgi:hypothetical protein